MTKPAVREERGRLRVLARLMRPWSLPPRRPSAAVRAPASALRRIREVAGAVRGSPRLRRRTPRATVVEAAVPARRQRRAVPGMSGPCDLLRMDVERRRDDGGHAIQRRAGGARLW